MVEDSGWSNHLPAQNLAAMGEGNEISKYGRSSSESPQLGLVSKHCPAAKGNVQMFRDARGVGLKHFLFEVFMPQSYCMHGDGLNACHLQQANSSRAFPEKSVQSRVELSLYTCLMRNNKHGIQTLAPGGLVRAFLSSLDYFKLHFHLLLYGNTFLIHKSTQPFNIMEQSRLRFSSI